MPSIAARPPSRRLAAILVVLACATFGQARGQAPPSTTKRLLVLPTEDIGIPAPPPPTGAALATAEATALPLGLHLGMSPEEVNARLTHPLASVAPSALGWVSYLGPATVDGFTIRMTDAGDMKPAITSCFAPTSLIFFQFVARKLYAVMFAIAPDATCRDTTRAADDLFQSMLAIPSAAMPAQHYRVGGLEIVEAWDPTVTSVIHKRWKAS